jgi:hypothetical protein
MDRTQLRAPIDACRIAGGDLQLPELAALREQIKSEPDVRDIFDRAQRLDGRIARAMHDVAVPKGMCERILARLEPTQALSAPAEQIALQTAAVEIQDADQPQPSRAHSREANRRQWLVGVSAVAAALLAGLGLWRFYAHGSPLSVASLLADSGRWHAQLEANPQWQALVRGDTLQNFPLALAVRAMPRGWADVSAWVGRPAVAYDLNVEPGRRVTLFVINDPGTAAESLPPRIPGSNTGGLVIGVWQADGLVYVLVVEGDQRRYDQLLDQSGAPLA